VIKINKTTYGKDYLQPVVGILKTKFLIELFLPEFFREKRINFVHALS